MTMTRCVLLLLVLASLPAVRPASAQPYRANCSSCLSLDRDIEALERRWDQSQADYYKEVGAAMELRRANVNDQAVVAAAKLEVSPEVAARAEREMQSRVAAREPQIKEHEARAAHHGRESAAIRARIAELRADLDECNRKCDTPGQPQQPATPRQEPAPVAPPAPSGIEQVAIPECPGCKDLATRLNDLLRQLHGARGTLEGLTKSRLALDNLVWELQREIRHYELTKFERTSPDEVRARDRLTEAERQIEKERDYRRVWEQEVIRLESEVSRLRERFEECNKACKPTTEVGRLLTPRNILIGAGVLVGTALTTIGGDSTPAPAPTTSAPPAPSAPPAVSLPAPQPSPAPPAAPAPAPPSTPSRPRIDGDYICLRCSVAGDVARHDPHIELCRLLLFIFGVSEGSITITHPPPFIAITGDFNTATGAFTATGRGTVAGFPNVGVRGQGTANSTTGEIEFTYTMGTGGELPGGQPITYSIALRRR